jgi:O-antigen/teichoic acid export membrane protein
MSRVNNSMKNLVASTGGEVLTILLKFITRSVFIKTLGTQYLGINGLFTNILSMLALAELGVGSAIIFDLYKPIAQNNKKKINQLMNLYRKTYRIIGLVVAALGVCLIPFLPYIIKDDVSFINVNAIFLLFLMQNVSTYLFFAYKSAIIKAHQKEYISTIIGYYFSIVTNIMQIIILVVFNNFTLYILTVVVFNILKNLFIALKSDKMFPYIKEKSDDILPKEERKHIFKNTFAIFIYKVNGVVVNATDNIILSIFIGLRIIGIYSNYLLIISVIKTMLNKFYNAIAASLGDLHASDDVENEHKIFKVVNFFTMCSYGLASIGTFVVANNFITLWIGEEFVLSQAFAFLVATEIYIFGLQKTLATFRTAMGLFQQAKYRPVFGIIINLGISILLVQYIGIYGVLIGTISSSLLTYMWFDPYIIYKHVFKRSVKEYYLTNIKYVLVIIIAGGLSYYLSSLINLDGVIFIIIQTLICFIVTGLIIFILYKNKPEFRYILNLINKMFLKAKLKINK